MSDPIRFKYLEIKHLISLYKVFCLWYDSSQSLLPKFNYSLIGIFVISFTKERSENLNFLQSEHYLAVGINQ